MLTVEAKPLVQKLNSFCTSCLEGAAGLCVNRGQYEITVEHWLMKALEHLQSDVPLMLAHFGVDISLLKTQLNHLLESYPQGNSGKPTFSPLLFDLVQDAWLISSITFGESKIRSSSMLIALIGKSRYVSGDYIHELKKISPEKFYKECGQVLRDSMEKSVMMGQAAGATPGEEGGQPNVQADGSFLKQFCEDVTGKARQGKIDPVFGRNDEIRQMIDILCRRRKNNPIAVGEPGVGKTALVEGLALKIAEGDVPDILKNVTLLTLDMALLEAGASVKGEFENRLKGVINEVKSSTTPIILFIDEAHTLIGDTSGGAANLLKPALARGELRTIAATTWQEYKKYFEKDAALSRRFQLVKLDEPSTATTVLILRGLCERYEQAHKVAIRDDALQAAATLAGRYVTGRQQPDKSIDLLDTCAARVKVNLASKPDVLEDKEKTLLALAREEKGIKRDQDNGVPVDLDRLKLIEKEVQTLEKEVKVLEERWKKEKTLVEAMLALRSEIAATKAEGKKVSDEQVKKREQLDKDLLKARNGETMVHYEVDPDAVAKVVSDWTGVPLGKVLRDEAQSLLMLENNFKTRIKGQDEALGIIAQHLKLAKSGLKAPEQPMGIFLLAGPSGVGKTETALTVADTLFGGEDSIVTISMSEFQEKHTISRLIGSPPGYVGYGEGGMLTEAVRQRPYTVVLLDEVEKSCLDVMNLFYQVFDKGCLTDGEGREVNFSNTVIFLTSNLATNEITQICQQQPDIKLEDMVEAIRPVLSHWFKPALLARTTIAPYKVLGPSALAGIVELKLGKIVKRMQEQNKIKLTYDPKVLDQIVARCKEVETGARNIDHILKGKVMPALSQTIIENMTTGKMPEGIHIDVDQHGEFIYKKH